MYHLEEGERLKFEHYKKTLFLVMLRKMDGVSKNKGTFQILNSPKNILLWCQLWQTCFSAKQVDIACGINDLQDIACNTVTFFTYVLMNVELPRHINCELGFKNWNEIVDWIIVKGCLVQKK